MKLQPGDYVSTEGMSEAQYHAVCKAFIDAGAADSDFVDTSPNVSYIVWDGGSNQVKFSGYAGFWVTKRKLTIDQILGSDNTEGAEEMNMSVAEAYKVMQANCGIGVGDTVKVLRKAEDYENGWGYDWQYRMNETIGTCFVVNGVTSGGILSKDWGYPFFVLELVKKGKKLPEPIRISSQYKCEFKENGGIAVGCQSLDFDLIEKIYMTAKEVKENV